MRLTPFLLVIVSQATTLVGFVLLDLKEGRLLSVLFALSLVFLLLGYVLERRRVSASVSPVESGPATVRAVYLFWAVVVGLVAYHFAVGGVPLFSSAVATQRFEFS